MSAAAGRAGELPGEGVRFDDLSEHGIERIDFLKMNIEGAERRALPGCEKALRRARYVCIAAHDFRAARGEGEEFRTLDFVKDFVTGGGIRDHDARRPTLLRAVSRARSKSAVSIEVGGRPISKHRLEVGPTRGLLLRPLRFSGPVFLGWSESCREAQGISVVRRGL